MGGGSDHMQKTGGMRATNPYHPFYGMWVTLARKPRWTDSVVAWCAKFIESPDLWDPERDPDWPN